MYQVISLAIAVLGGILLFSPDYLISKDNKDSTFKMVYDNHQVLGVLSLAIAYYVYTMDESYKTSSSSIASSEQEISELPTYEESVIKSSGEK